MWSTSCSLVSAVMGKTPDPAVDLADLAGVPSLSLALLVSAFLFREVEVGGGEEIRGSDLTKSGADEVADLAFILPTTF